MADKKITTSTNSIARALTLLMAEEEKDFREGRLSGERYSAGYFSFRGLMTGLMIAHEHPEFLQQMFADLAEFDAIGAKDSMDEVRDSADIIVEGMPALERILKREGLSNEPRPRGTGLDGLFRGSGFDDRTH